MCEESAWQIPTVDSVVTGINLVSQIILECFEGILHSMNSQALTNFVLVSMQCRYSLLLSTKHKMQHCWNLAALLPQWWLNSTNYVFGESLLLQFSRLFKWLLQHFPGLCVTNNKLSCYQELWALGNNFQPGWSYPGRVWLPNQMPSSWASHPAVLLHSLGGWDWLAQTQGVSKSAAVAVGSHRLAWENCATTLVILTQFKSQQAWKVLMICRFWTWNFLWNRQEVVANKSSFWAPIALLHLSIIHWSLSRNMTKEQNHMFWIKSCAKQQT